MGQITAMHSKRKFVLDQALGNYGPILSSDESSPNILWIDFDTGTEDDEYIHCGDKPLSVDANIDVEEYWTVLPDGKYQTPSRVGYCPGCKCLYTVKFFSYRG